MVDYEQQLRAYIEEQQIQAEHLSFTQSCHSVEEAALAVNATVEDLIKSICLLDDENRLVVAIVKGEDRVSTSRVAKALELPAIRMATPDEILARTGYPCGGTPSFGYAATFLVDQKVMEREVVFAGGGSENSLVRIGTAEMVRVNQGKIARIRR
jgi:prolyl-tRNA editing enzyme YbaK/EbsC (Cys-tRNA(Pro) deacylase)